MQPTNHIQHEESTYALLVRSEEGQRNLSESAVYVLLILCTVFSIWQSARQPFQLPNIGMLQSAPVVQVAPGLRHSA
jgi:hypothetical protein